VRAWKVLPVALVALAVAVPHGRAQGVPWLSERSLPISLFERYLESLRQQAGIPGLSAAIVQNGQRVWDAGFGFQDVEGLVRATADTPYPILDLSQMLASTVLLHHCVELRHLELLGDRVRRWHPQFSEETTTVSQLLAHTASDGGFRYDTGRYAGLTTVAEQCASIRYPPLLSNDVLERLGMRDSVPGHDLGDSSASHRGLFSTTALDRFGAVLRRVAPPYRIDSNRRPSRSDYSRPSLSAASGVVSTVRDLSLFDAGLNVLLTSNTRERAWEQGSTPMGLGWFVQRHNGERIIWHFGMARDAYSALYIKVPGRDLTLILLANSDGLAAPYNLSDGNLTTSLFAQAFLQLFVS
jgi:CubicO group peptidase (beta-lactamase class C family)